MKAGIAPSSVRMERYGDNLYVRVFGVDGVVTDSLTVKGYYVSSKAKVERVVFADGTVWGTSKMDALRIRWGTTSRNNELLGSDRSDIFDVDEDFSRNRFRYGWIKLHGRSGDDVYWFGRGKGYVLINEADGNSGNGDAGDEIRMKAGIAPSSVRMERKGSDLDISVVWRGRCGDGLVEGYRVITGRRVRVWSVWCLLTGRCGALRRWTRCLFGGGRLVIIFLMVIRGVRTLLTRLPAAGTRFVARAAMTCIGLVAGRVMPILTRPMEIRAMAILATRFA